MGVLGLKGVESGVGREGLGVGGITVCVCVVVA